MIFKLFILYMVLLIPYLVENKLTVRMKGLNCISTDEQYVEFSLCEVKPLNRDAFEVSIYAKIFQKPIHNTEIIMKLYKRGFEHLRPIYDFTIDICAFFRNKRRNPIASALYEIFGYREYSNINHTCPFNHDLILHKYRWNDTYVQLLPLPTATYAFHFNWSVSNKPRGIISLYFQILNK